MDLRDRKLGIKIFTLSIILSSLFAGCVFVYQYYFSRRSQRPQPEIADLTPPSTPTKEVLKPKIQDEMLKLDSQKAATYLSKVANTQRAYWLRGLAFSWGDIEPTKGVIDWSDIDQKFMEVQDQEICHLAMILPFANWDQDVCHPESRYQAEFNPNIGEYMKVGKPCDMPSYANYLEKVVERYDGDGIDDMPDLKVPIKYWEIMNEPSMQGGVTGGMGEELKFFVGTPQEYFDILKVSFETIKKADSNAKVAHAGMAGMHKEAVDFWEPIFAAGGGTYFDIANMHTITTDKNREDLYVIKFKRLLEEYGIADKPIWLTEVQFGSLTKLPSDINEFEKLIVRASIFSLVQGADKLFYIDNWLSWNGMEEFEKDTKQDKEKKFGEEKEKFEKEPEEGEKKKEWDKIIQNPTHRVYLNLVDKINNFTKIEVIEEKFVENLSVYDGATSSIGQYKFIDGERVVYVLWGSGGIPGEIKGQLKVTNIRGEVEEISSSEIVLTDSPIFIEFKKD